MLTEIPSIEDELERKAMEELSRIIHLYESGRITHREMGLMLDTLWSCVSGLAGEGWRELIEEARRVPNEDTDWRLFGFHPEKELVVFARRSEEDFTVTIFRKRDWQVVKDIHKDHSLEEQPSVIVTREYKALIKELVSKSFIFLT